MKLVFLGPPGSGKGTQASVLKKEYGFAHLSTGDMLRASIESNSDIGKQVKDVIKRGALVKDSIVVSIVLERIVNSDCNKGYILDGFRNIFQAEEFAKVNCVDAVILFKLDTAILLERVEHRIKMMGDNTRSDDNPEILKERLKVYDVETFPLIEYYRQRNLLKVVDAMDNIEGVSRQVRLCLNL